MKRNQEPQRVTDAPRRDDTRAADETREVRSFERPRLRRLGVLPVVTTAFGGSFSP
ncbi:MAG: hypothetical protein H6737_05550 [Alphaproteobacteria bacterium]|nr:hypothetical protein [Alphaproteobacteria bacterium]